MIQMMKDITIDKIENKWMKTERMDIVREASNLFIEITLKCMFGSNFNDQSIVQTINGEKKNIPLGESILYLMECSIKRVY
jgi:hypothetical protein